MPWSAWIHTGFHVSRATQDTTRSALVLNYGTVTRYGHTFQSVRLTAAFHIVVLQPHRDKSRWFGLFRVRSPLLTESILFLFQWILRCFTSPRIALPVLFIETGVMQNYLHWVAPFGNLRIKACVPLPEAYRSLLRPSSPDDAKASINCCNWFMQTPSIPDVYLTYYSINLS
jgi:hypothetical protein